MDGRAIAAGAVAAGGMRQLTSESDGPRPGGIEQGSVMRAAALETTSVAQGETRLRPKRD